MYFTFALEKLVYWHFAESLWRVSVFSQSLAIYRGKSLCIVAHFQTCIVAFRFFSLSVLSRKERILTFGWKYFWKEFFSAKKKKFSQLFPLGFVLTLREMSSLGLNNDNETMANKRWFKLHSDAASCIRVFIQYLKN
jgi:hypothetical protein